MRALSFILFLCICIAATPVFSQAQNLLLDDFEGEISGGPEGTLNFSAGGGSSVEVVAATDIKYSGKQSLKVTYKAVPAVPPGCIWVGKGSKGSDFGPNAHWLIEPKDIYWEEFNAIAFYMYGSDSKTRIIFDIKDNGFEIWRFIVEDNFIGWKQIVCPFSEFQLRNDWQPSYANRNGTLSFPIRSFQFEPLPDGEIKKGTVYFDKIELINK